MVAADVVVEAVALEVTVAVAVVVTVVVALVAEVGGEPLEAGVVFGAGEQALSARRDTTTKPERI